MIITGEELVSYDYATDTGASYHVDASMFEEYLNGALNKIQMAQYTESIHESLVYKYREYNG